jgi:predicted RNA binding protein YcfA (HicA-like mRNA interferase family)
MSKIQKILSRIVTGSGTVTYAELTYVLARLGFEEIRTGKTSGSRVAFWHRDKDIIIRLHKPHPGNELKDYQVKMIRSLLEQNKLI